MKTIKIIDVPTGKIIVVKNEIFELMELVSIGDYGKEVNVKADFLGLTKELSKVQHTKMLPLSAKWVITISTQTGCSMGCKFCDVPKVGPGFNVEYYDLMNQIIHGIRAYPDVKYTNRLNIHFARMGEPSFNPNVLGCAVNLREYIKHDLECKTIHPVVSTMMPRNNPDLEIFLKVWCGMVKNRSYKGEASLQLSINSTNEEERKDMFNNNSLSLEEIASMMKKIEPPIGRKYTLNFAIADYEINAEKLRELFDPKYFLVKLTPMHKTERAVKFGVKTPGEYTTFAPYKQPEEALKKAGFDVIVFLASEYEDMGRITCGNAILSGSLPECPYTVTNGELKNDTHS